MRGRSVLILLVLVSLLLAFIFFVERDLPSSEERKEREAKVLRLESDALTAIEIERSGERVVLQREVTGEGEGDSGSEAANGWRLVEPLRSRADNGSVDRLVAILENLRSQRVLEDVELGEVGLESPRASLSLTQNDKTSTLLIGSEVPASNNMVVTVSGSGKVLVVDRELWSSVERSPGDWRSRQVFPGDRDEIDRLVVENPSGRIELQRQGEDFWVIEPFADLADADRTDDLLGAIATLQVASFVDGPVALPDLGLEPPARALEVSSATSEEDFRLELGGGGAGENELYARAEEVVFTIEAGIETRLDGAAESWRSLRLTNWQTFQVDALTLAQGDFEVLEVERAGANWRRNDVEIDFTSVSDLLFTLTDAVASGVMDASRSAAEESQMGKPSLTITLKGNRGEETVAFFESTEGPVLVTISGRPSVLKFDDKDFSEIVEKVAAVRAAENKRAVDEGRTEREDSSVTTDEES